jgi:hypothetical protein
MRTVKREINNYLNNLQQMKVNNLKAIEKAKVWYYSHLKNNTVKNNSME